MEPEQDGTHQSGGDFCAGGVGGDYGEPRLRPQFKHCAGVKAWAWGQDHGL